MIKEKLDAILARSHFPWWEWNIQDNTVSFNELKVTMLGYTMNDFRNCGYEAFTRLVHPDDYPHTMKAMKDVLDGKTKLYQTDYRIRAANNSYKWYMDRGYVLAEDKKGLPLLIRGIVIDLGFEKDKIENTRALISIINNSMVNTGSGMVSFLTICSNCRKAKKDKDIWIAVTPQLIDLIGEKVSHGICPSCMSLLYPDYVKAAKGR
jgi:hypothetical protein